MKNYVQLFIVVSVFFSTLRVVSAQSLEDSIKQSFSSFVPSEKLYLHTDKPNYFLADTIWFAGYLRSGYDLGDVYSNFIYVELIDSRDSVVVRKKIKRIDNLFQGYLELKDDILEGEYCIRGYSNWMQNFPRENFFYKNITVRDFTSDAVKWWADLHRADSSNFSFNLGVLGGDALINKWSNQSLDLSIRNLTTGKRSRLKDEITDSKASISLDLEDIEAGDLLLVELKGEVDDRKLNHTMRIRVPAKDFDIQFLPEGGDLISGGLRRIAYKTLSSRGTPLDVEGYILDENSDTTLYFHSSRAGMGVIELDATQGRSYTAFVTTSDSLTKSVKLPTIKSDGVALSLDYRDSGVTYHIEKVGAFSSEKLYAILHSRGRLNSIRPVVGSSVSYDFPYDSLSAGISHLLIVNSKSEPIADRLFFVDPSHYNQGDGLSIIADKDSYGRREKVSLSIDCPEDFTGNFSISVTDDKFVKVDSTADNIVSNLLLTSDLNGTIEDPASYLGSADVDLLMLTNGWRKFDVESLLNSTMRPIDYSIEVGQVVSGKISTKYKKVAESTVFCQVVDSEAYGIAKLNPDLSFMIGPLDIEEEQKVLIQVINRHKKFISAKISATDNIRRALPWVKSDLATVVSNPSDYNSSSIANPITDATPIEKIVVEKKRGLSREEKFLEHELYRLKRKYHMEYKSKYNYYVDFTPEQIEHIDLFDIIEYLGPRWRVGELIINGVFYDEFTLKDPEILEWQWPRDIPFFMGKDITAMEFNPNVFREPQEQVLIGSDDGRRHVNGTIIVEMKPSYATDQLIFNYSGYNRCEKEFYSPKYIADEVDDLYDIQDFRTTLYWSPKVEIVDGELITPIEFYTSDNIDSKLTVIIEGIEIKTKTPINYSKTISTVR